MPSSSNNSDNDDIICQGFKLKGDLQMRDARDVMRYLLRKTPQGHGLVSVDKLHPVTKRKRQASQTTAISFKSTPDSLEHDETAMVEPTMQSTDPQSSKHLETDISQPEAQAESSDDEPSFKRRKNSTASTDVPSDTLTSEAETECPSYSKFICVSQYKGVYKPPRSSPDTHPGYRHWESDVESSVGESQPRDLPLEGVEESSRPEADRESSRTENDNVPGSQQ
ncbi:hypothetical protein VNI00_019327 [Paramarasmius palmivorus]|uniref:Uncharacterized protein n=1 Tax=Paramarasmius palmivorus TaxID=297713 RepID=A0AAW0AQV3_9AGAR